VVSETVVAQRLQLEHAYATRGYLGRNNSGACTDETGRQIRYGLGNISAQHNREIKSSDYIGCTPTLILPHMVGYYLGVFTAFETKPSGWKLTPGDERGQAQAKFHRIIRESCGYAGFVTDVADMYRIIGREPPQR
jgi:hypothetical protein